ncbi:site-2 protease family protein [Tsuneonella mangrovi]|uniref:site-2 protease family protein n=1 Tax=Tsuneonella mangrovi TaxID=1982042 RepID=UPI000BA2A467|nr:site-2 protease family protein [Tsuneonella mangrovi]
MSDTLQLAILLIPCLIVSIVFHEVAHGYSALLLGDPTAQERRRLSLNPLRHVDPVGTLLVPGALALFGGPVFGWAKPVPVNFRRLSNPRVGMMLVAAAGPMTNFVLAAVGAVLLGLYAGSFGLAAAGPGAWFPTMMQLFITINVFLGLFNLLPLPPFDGSHIVEGLLPRSLAAQYGQLRQFGMFLFVALIAATWAFPQYGIIEHVVGPPVNWALGHYLALAQAVAGR